MKMDAEHENNMRYLLCTSAGEDLSYSVLRSSKSPNAGFIDLKLMFDISLEERGPARSTLEEYQKTKRPRKRKRQFYTQSCNEISFAHNAVPCYW